MAMRCLSASFVLATLVTTRRSHALTQFSQTRTFLHLGRTKYNPDTNIKSILNNNSPLFYPSWQYKPKPHTMTTTNAESAGLGDIGKKMTISKNDDSSDDITSWQKNMDISIAKSRKIRGSNYVQIATVDSTTNEPRCRTVVFRGFLSPESFTVPLDSNVSSSVDSSRALKMITDLRSNKASKENHTAELVWWFPKSSEQYRVRGQLIYVGGGDFPNDDHDFLSQARKQQWGNLSDMAREQFYWRDPGVTYETQVDVPKGGRDEGGKVLPPPNNFLLMLLFPCRVDYLRLGDNFRQIDEYVGTSWKVERVNP